MRKGIFLVLTILYAVVNSSAQEGEISTGLGAGLQLNQYQNDFGIGLQVTSPHFVYDGLAVRLRGNLMFNQHIENNETTWTPYSNLSIGVLGISGKVGEHIRLYGEGGIIGLFPSEEFSSENFELGGYGLFGFEFFMSQNDNYFIEIGGMGSGAAADNIPGSPIYSNGLLISVGYRHLF